MKISKLIKNGLVFGNFGVKLDKFLLEIVMTATDPKL
ncbi:ribose 5-phosphate isomerase A, partial [Moraxella catarrhalis]|nr:ribose 5-phosphate isomerase A [Moraxella catarrhalis]